VVRIELSTSRTARGSRLTKRNADIARGGFGGEVLDLVEHGRPVREKAYAVHGGSGEGHDLRIG